MHNVSDQATQVLESQWSPQSAEIVQFVTPEGKLTPLGHDRGVDDDLARDLYRDMARARRLDAEALALQRQGELGLWLQVWGQEAAQVGSMHALRATDHVFPSFGEHAAAMVRGISPTELMSQWRGAAHAGWDPARYAFHFYSLVLGTQTLHATCYGLRPRRWRSCRDHILRRRRGERLCASARSPDRVAISEHFASSSVDGSAIATTLPSWQS